MRVITRTVQAIIFDLDGVLVDSRAAVDAAWKAWSAEFDIPFDVVAATIPGRRTRDAVRQLAPQLDADAQAERIIAHEQRLASEVVAIPGAVELLAAVPAERWGIATSGIDAIARPRLRYAGLPVPSVLITAEMVQRGKPDPEAYSRAAATLGFNPAECAVFEDAPDGIVAASRAGCFAVGVLTWASPSQLATPVVIRDLRSVEITATASHIALRIESVDEPAPRN